MRWFNFCDIGVQTNKLHLQSDWVLQLLWLLRSLFLRFFDAYFESLENLHGIASWIPHDCIICTNNGQMIALEMNMCQIRGMWHKFASECVCSRDLYCILFFSKIISSFYVIHMQNSLQWQSSYNEYKKFQWSEYFNKINRLIRTSPIKTN